MRNMEGNDDDDDNRFFGSFSLAFLLHVIVSRADREIERRHGGGRAVSEVGAYQNIVPDKRQASKEEASAPRPSD